MNNHERLLNLAGEERSKPTKKKSIRIRPTVTPTVVEFLDDDGEMVRGQNAAQFAQ